MFHHLFGATAFAQIGILLTGHQIVIRLSHIVARFTLLAVVRFIAFMRQPGQRIRMPWPARADLKGFAIGCHSVPFAEIPQRRLDLRAGQKIHAGHRGQGVSLNGTTLVTKYSVSPKHVDGTPLCCS